MAGKLGYFSNTYPVPSATFVRGEILAHEAAGVPVRRYAIRPFEGELVDPADLREAWLTAYLLDPSLKALVGPALREAVVNPLRFLRALGRAARMAVVPGGRGAYNFAYLLEAVRLKALTRADGIRHLHAHFSTNSASVAMLCKLLGGPEYSFTVHGPDELPKMKTDGIAAKVGHARFVVAITDFARRAIIDAAGAKLADKIEIVPCGLDMPRFSVAGPIAADNKRLVCVGRLCWQKAQVRLVEAVAQVRNAHPDMHLTLIGDGDTRPEIEALIQQHALHDQVTLHGWGTNDEVRAAIAGSRALVLPSEAEGLPIVIMEALAMGRPVISTRIAGIPELLDDGCGWLIETRDLPALAGALDDCLSADPSRLHALGAEGRRRVEVRHDQARNAARIRKLIDLNAKNPSRA
jgi:glycosyltransferase involved in cell wall biosynthesis